MEKNVGVGFRQPKIPHIHVEKNVVGSKSLVLFQKITYMGVSLYSLSDPNTQCRIFFPDPQHPVTAKNTYIHKYPTLLPQHPVQDFCRDPQYPVTAKTECRLTPLYVIFWNSP